MAFYLVRAELRPELVGELYRRMTNGELRQLRPFGASLTASLSEAHWDPAARQAVWEEECYCQPPLAQERREVLDRYCSSLTTERVAQNEGWRRASQLPKLWDALGHGFTEREFLPGN